MRDNEKNNEKIMREEIKEFADKVDTDTRLGNILLGFVYGSVRYWHREELKQKGGAV